jgi:hypothetical protein
MRRKIALFLSFFVRNYFRMRYFGRVTFGKKVIINLKFKFIGKGKLFILDDVNMWAHEEKNRFFTYDKNAQIIVGEFSRLNGVTVQCRESVKIGKRCLIGSVLILDNDFHSVDYLHRNDIEYVKVKPVVIGDDVWVAGQSVILKGVEVGDRAVVGIRAVVTKNVLTETIVAGNPAKEIGKIKD